MRDETGLPEANLRPLFMISLGSYALLGCILFAIAILIADFVVPDHNWIADTISDLGAGKYEFIVDIGIYAFAASLISIALLAAHDHLGGWRWSLGAVGFAVLGLIVFLVGARNEYGDNDSDGWIIHVYLVYALGLLMALLPWAMSRGAARISSNASRILIAISILWSLSAPVFFFLPNDIDGIYERYLGLISFFTVGTMAWLFIRHAIRLR
ncbi:DUF998 domain-containing protein [Hoeflea sp. AS60]|uniref:DUF998 domain-containing protein n=1 Tax=Hoeflea sp. AS60 TaxID=3135780 RepID=UPI00317107FD